MRRRPVAAFAVVVAVLVAVVNPAPGAAVAGSAGTDTAIPPTDSAVSISGRGAFSSLRLTVNQTGHLVNQAVSISWTGARPTQNGPSPFGQQYLQMMQCWGDDDGTNPDNPGPPPEQCVQGASAAAYGGVPGGQFPPGTYALDRIVSRATWPGFDPTAGVLDERTGLVWKPFRAVDGTTVGIQKDPKFDPAVVGGNFWLNPYFNIVTTNEIAGGRSRSNGTGAELMEVETGVESSGLGCGQRSQPDGSGGYKVPKCWLVVVPRGDAETENADTPYTPDQGVMTSPLSTRAWRNRIAIPLDFNPVDSLCSLSANQRRIVGSELATAAVVSWQPKLCQTPGLPPYAYGSVGDALARTQVTSGVPGAPGMAIVSRPIDPGRVSADDPAVYAPISLSAPVIGFNVERNPRFDAGNDALAIGGIRVADIKLTPRLVAKLLSQSYASQVRVAATTPPYDWVVKNPADLAADPDFLRFNPEFELLDVASQKNFGGLLMPSAASDVARQVWEWVLADPEAKTWMDGVADPWGMRVNPVYATTSAASSTGAAFATAAPDSFPKADPYCYQAPHQGVGGSVVPPPLCGTDWLPYTQTFREAAHLTRIGDDGAKVVLDPFAISADQVYKRDIPQTLGKRAILSLTDSASAAQFGLQTAQLSRAGDDNDGRSFVPANPRTVAAAVASMAPGADASVLEPRPLAAPTDAYPLAALTYAAITPLSLDETARREYAAFVEYAAGPGQVPGLQLGELPPGYAPLPAALRQQALDAARTIRELQPPPQAAESSEPSAAESMTAPMAGPEDAPVATAAPAKPATSGRRLLAPSAERPQPVAAPPPAAPAEAKVEAQPARVPMLMTPVVAVARTRFALLGLFVIMLLSILGALEVTKRPRRAVRRATGQGTYS